MRSALLVSASLLAMATTVPLATAAHANIAISVNKSTQRMTVAVDGQQRYVWPVSTGRAGYQTPSGSFRINRLDADHHSKEYDNAFMPDSMFFDLEGHAIHGFNDVPHLGMAVSHGCVRLSPANAAVLFDLVKTEGIGNTSVSITGHIPNSPLVASRRTPTQEAANEPTQIVPGYSQSQPYPAPQPYYRQQQAPQYSSQQAPQYQGQQYAQRQSLFPPQPQPYGQPAYGQRYYAQPQDGGQGYYAQPGYGAPAYRQW